MFYPQCHLPSAWQNALGLAPVPVTHTHTSERRDLRGQESLRASFRLWSNSHRSCRSEVVEECCSPLSSQEADRVTCDMSFSAMTTTVTCFLRLASVYTAQQSSCPSNPSINHSTVGSEPSGFSRLSKVPSLSTVLGTKMSTSKPLEDIFTSKP